MNWIIDTITGYYKPQTNHPRSNMPCIESHKNGDDTNYRTVSEMVWAAFDKATHNNIPITSQHLDLSTFGVRGDTMTITIPHYPYPYYDAQIKIQVRPNGDSLESAIREILN